MSITTLRRGTATFRTGAVRSGIVVAAAFSLFFGIPLTAEAQAPSYEYQRQVVATFYDGHGREVLLRRGWWVGGRGFGWDKIYHKHKITNLNLIKKIIKNPNGGTVSGTAREYRGLAQRFQCDMSGRCTEMERIELKAVVEFRIDSNMQGQKGVITAYCNFGGPVCPNWVNNVANVAPS